MGCGVRSRQPEAFRLIFLYFEAGWTLKSVLDVIEDPKSPCGPGLSNI